MDNDKTTRAEHGATLRRNSSRRLNTGLVPDTTFNKLLSSIPVSTLVLDNVIDAEETEQISVLFQRLIKNGILSVPVYSVKDGVKHYFGFVDIMDILYSFLENKNGGKHKTVADIINLSERNPWLSLHCEDNIQQACGILSGAKTVDSVHRCAVFQKDSETKQDLFYSVLSQSKVVQFISERIKNYSIGKKTIEELRLGFREVLSIDVNRPLLEALATLRKYRISGIAITKEGKIVGHIDASDLADIYKMPKGLNEVLKAPLSEYFSYHKRAAPIFFRPKEASLETVCVTMVQQKVPRVYLVEEEDQLVGLITMSDILVLWVDGDNFV